MPAFVNESGVGCVACLFVHLLQHLAAEFAVGQRPSALHNVSADRFIVVTEAVASGKVRAHFAGGEVEQLRIVRQFFEIENARGKFPRLFRDRRVIFVVSGFVVERVVILVPAIGVLSFRLRANNVWLFQEFGSLWSSRSFASTLEIS